MPSFLGVGKEKLETIKKNELTLNLRTLDECMGGEDEEFTLSDTVTTDQTVEDDIIRQLDTNSMTEALWKVINELPGNMAEVLRHRYRDKMTLKEIWKKFRCCYRTCKADRM